MSVCLVSVWDVHYWTIIKHAVSTANLSQEVMEAFAQECPSLQLPQTSSLLIHVLLVCCVHLWSSAYDMMSFQK